MTWGDFWLENGPVIVSSLIGLIALFVASTKNKVDDRQQELAIQGAYLEASKEDRQEVREMRAMLSSLQRQELVRQEEVARLKVALAEGRASSDKLVNSLEYEKELRKTEAAKHEAGMEKVRAENMRLTDKVQVMTVENGELRQRVAALSEAMKLLQVRMDEVEAQSKANKQEAEALRVKVDEEKAARLAAEAARDKLRDERDALLDKVDNLQKELETERLRVTEQSEALQALRDELNEVRQKLEESKADEETTI